MKTLLLLLPLLTALTACCPPDAGGCTDPLSLTYNPDAIEDDQSCLYVADTYAGTYEAHDTTEIYHPGAPSTFESRTYTFKIHTTGNPNRVELDGLLTCLTRADVTLHTMTLVKETDCGIHSFIATADNGVLHFTYRNTSNNTRTFGRATWTQ